MKKTILTLITLCFLTSCSNTSEDGNMETNQLEGKWKLIEQLADPGDGSGTFQSIESNKTLQFKIDGIITSNESLCNPYSTEEISEGIYSIIDKTIVTNCQNTNISKISFELIDGYLILNFISNEGFSQKFQKI